MATQPLIINNFDQAIADSPHKGFGLMSRVDIEGYPGAVKAGKSLTSMIHTALSTTFTAATTDLCTVTSGTLPNTGVAIVLTTTGTLPAGLSTATIYFLIKISSTTFEIATTIANANSSTQIDITDTGSGTHTVATIDPTTINHIVKDPRTGEKFHIDSTGRVWYGTSAPLLLLHNSAIDNGSTVTNASGQGLAITAFSHANKTWLFAFRNQLIDVIDVFGDTAKETPSWSNAWQTMNAGAGDPTSHHAIISQDNIIYYCDDQYIGSIQEKSGQTFEAATSSTYTFTQQALDLPNHEAANWIEELGIKLLVAGDTWNKIYPWDRTSDSFNLPIIVPEDSVKKLKNIGGIVYILAGTWGNIYTTQGIFVRHFKKIPQQISNNSTSDLSNPITWGGVGSLNGALLFGMQASTTANSGAYLLYPDGRLILDQIPTTGAKNVTAFEVTNNFYVFGYSDGVDAIAGDRYTALEGIVQSAFYRVATKTEKATFSVLEVVLAKPAVAGNVRIGYREDTTGSFTTLDTFAADGSTTVFQKDAIGLNDIENIQLQAEIDDDVELVEIRLLP